MRCEYCGKSFKYRNKKGKKRIFCSATCRTYHSNENFKFKQRLPLEEMRAFRIIQDELRIGWWM